MVAVARERIEILFRQAESASREGALEIADRDVRLARRIGTRYNLRLPSELRARFCRRCFHYLQEGVTSRTRLRQGRRVVTCLSCGRSYQRPYRAKRSRATSSPPLPGPLTEPIAVPVDELGEGEGEEGEELDEA
ncbi:MAG: ribonuclease P [Euryarchaeota archaeon]|nr:ribonuclease P [Euryarchaeota archaeon]MDE2043561.1 ribonuclease P [Thermoplasmata archaeon]